MDDVHLGFEPFHLLEGTIIFCNELGNITTISIQNSLVYSVTFKEHIESIIIKHNYPLALAMVNS